MGGLNPDFLLYYGFQLLNKANSGKTLLAIFLQKGELS